MSERVSVPTVRSITYTVDFDKVQDDEYCLRIISELEALNRSFSDSNVFIRTRRLNIIQIQPQKSIDYFDWIKRVENIRELCDRCGIRWFNVSFNMTNASRKECMVVQNLSYELLKRYPQAFCNHIVSTMNDINLNAIQSGAQLISDLSGLSNNGFDNFRYGMSMNACPSTPFFPFSYGVSDLGFSIAIETCQSLGESLRSSMPNMPIDGKLSLAKQDLIADISTIHSVALEVEALSQSTFFGVDISLAPFPDEKISVISVLRQLGLQSVGGPGTLFMTSKLTAFLKSILSEGGFRACGFNGVMYSLLEDHLLCELNDKKLISADKLISYSALCGCGLDMVPLPGAVLPDEVVALGCDLAALAGRLNKPLGLRVLPIPGAEANEFTNFDSDFLTNTRVMEASNLGFASEFLKDNGIVQYGK